MWKLSGRISLSKSTSYDNDSFMDSSTTPVRRTVLIANYQNHIRQTIKFTGLVTGAVCVYVDS